MKDLLFTVEVTRFDYDAALRCCELGTPDFEDSMIASAAIECEAELILTRNERDFADVSIPVQSREVFNG